MQEIKKAEKEAVLQQLALAGQRKLGTIPRTAANLVAGTGKRIGARNKHVLVCCHWLAGLFYLLATTLLQKAEIC